MWLTLDSGTSTKAEIQEGVHPPGLTLGPCEDALAGQPSHTGDTDLECQAPANLGPAETS